MRPDDRHVAGSSKTSPAMDAMNFTMSQAKARPPKIKQQVAAPVGSDAISP